MRLGHEACKGGLSPDRSVPLPKQLGHVLVRRHKLSIWFASCHADSTQNMGAQSKPPCTRYTGKVAVVTASTAGIGLGIATRLGQEGAKVHACSS